MAADADIHWPDESCQGKRGGEEEGGGKKSTNFVKGANLHTVKTPRATFLSDLPWSCLSPFPYPPTDPRLHPQTLTLLRSSLFLPGPSSSLGLVCPLTQAMKLTRRTNRTSVISLS